MTLRNQSLILAFLLALWSVQVASGQQDKTLFLMHDLPQANIVNPAVGIKCKYYIGIPLLSSVHFNYSNTLATPSELFMPQSHSTGVKLDFQSIVNQTHNVDLISVEAELTLLDFGYHWNNNYLTFSVRENVIQYTTIPQDAVFFAYYGNTYFLGETANLGGLRVNATHYREYDLGFSTDVNEKLRLGMRVQLLFGKSNITTSNYSGGLFTDANTFGISTDLSYAVNTSAPVDVYTKPDGTFDSIRVRKNIDLVDYAFNRKNVGLAIDLGAIYKYSEQITLSASVLDLGSILWQSNVNNFSAAGNFSYQGEINGVGNNQSLRDSITGSYEVEIGKDSYFSNLLPRVYLGATYQPLDHFNFGATFYSEILMNKIHPAFGISVNTVGFKMLTGSLMWSAQNSTYSNIGLGIGAKFGCLHLHLTSDNVPAFFALDNTRNINLRFGINLLLGCGGAVSEKSRGRATSGYKSLGIKVNKSTLPSISCPSGESEHKPKQHRTGYKPANLASPPKSNLKYQRVTIFH